MEEKVTTFRLNPNIDFYFGFISTKPIPTKQDKFAPIKIETYYEIDESILKRANLIWSLSPLTFPHQLVRLILSEQVYRACTIIKGEKYHHA